MASDQAVDAAARGVAEPEPAGGVFSNRDFVKLWAGETVSQIGNQVTLLAMPLVAVLTLKAPVFEVGVLNALKFVPVLVVSVFAGVWLDRRRRRPVLIACALSNAVVIGLVPIASTVGLLSIGLLYVVTLLAGTLTSVFDVGALSYVPDLVQRRHLGESNSRLQASQAVAGISGPGLAGFLVGLLTAPITLSVDAVSYLFSATGLLLIRKPETEPERPAERPSVRQSIAEGFRSVYGSRLLRPLLAQSVTLNLVFGAAFTLFMVYAVRYLGLTAAQLGVVVAAAAVGGLVGALAATRVRSAIGFGRTMMVATIGVSGGLLPLMIPHGAGPVTMVVLVLAQFLYGGSISMFNVNAITLRQAATPRRVLARMNATYRMVLFGAGPFGSVAGGLLGSALGLRTALIISLLAMLSPALWLFFSPVFRLAEVPAAPLEDTDEASPTDEQMSGGPVRTGPVDPKED